MKSHSHEPETRIEPATHVSMVMDQLIPRTVQRLLEAYMSALEDLQEDPMDFAPEVRDCLGELKRADSLDAWRQHILEDRCRQDLEMTYLALTGLQAMYGSPQDQPPPLPPQDPWLQTRRAIRAYAADVLGIDAD